MKPVRIQRKRERGWRKPPNTVCVTRGCKWGNRFVVNPDLPRGAKVDVDPRIGSFLVSVPTAQEAVKRFEDFLRDSPDLVEKARAELRGKNLACWCNVGEPCHGDVLLRVANSDTGLWKVAPPPPA